MKQCGNYGPRMERKIFYSKFSSCLFIIIVYAVSIKAYNNSTMSEAQALMYLAEYGYLSPETRNPHSGQLISSDSLSKAVMEFQAFVNLNVTGYLDDETLRVMSLPRCGVRDKFSSSKYFRSRRYIVQGTRWKVKDLTYKISKYPKHLNRQDTDKTIAQAFSAWSAVTPLKFHKKTIGQVHIDIRFEVGEHGDQDPFDGPGGTLAHAYFPIYGGDAHFDDAERWTIESHKGTNLLQVAAHEFGHSLGLVHSEVDEALMAPVYRGYQKNFKLHRDDIEGIRALYGTREDDENPPEEDDEDQGPEHKPPSTSKPTSTHKPNTSTYEPPTLDGDAELCNDGTLDTIFNSAEGVTYVFRGAHYWKLTDNGIESGYPKRISQKWIGLPNHIDAAFTYNKNGRTYFFKGSKYWKYDGKRMDGDYPKDINEGFTGIPDNINAAMVWNGNGKIYFFKGSKFWKFDPTQMPPVKSTYPKLISNWKGVPDNLDDALQYTNGFAYFFKGGQYWRFNDRTFSVDTADPPFPRAAGFWWFGCRAESRRNYLLHKIGLSRSKIPEIGWLGN